MNFTKNVAITFLTKIFLIGVGLGNSILTARLLAPAGKGMMSIICLVPAMLFTAGNLGIGTASVYLIGQKKYKTEDFISNSINIVGLIGGTLIISFWLFFGFYSEVFKGIEKLLLFIATLTVFFDMFDDYSFNIMLGCMRIKEYNGIKFAKPSLLLLCLFIFLVVLRWGVKGAVLSYFGSKLVTCIIAIYLFSRFAKIRLSFNASLLKSSLCFGAKANLGYIFQFLNYRLDMFLVSYYLGVEMVGYYVIAVTIAEIVLHLPNSVAAILYPLASSTKSEGKKADFTALVCRNTLFITVIFSGCLLAMSKLLIQIFYGLAYLPSLRPLYFLMPGVVALSISLVLTSYVYGQGKPGILAGITGASLGANIGLNMVFIPKIGLSGAALASTISYILPTGIIMLVFLKFSGKRLSDILILKRADIDMYLNVVAKVCRKNDSTSVGGDDEVSLDGHPGVSLR